MFNQLLEYYSAFLDISRHEASINLLLNPVFLMKINDQVIFRLDRLLLSLVFLKINLQLVDDFSVWSVLSEAKTGGEKCRHWFFSQSKKTFVSVLSISCINQTVIEQVKLQNQINN